jgi:YhcH/YjgK/YiaL family protein
MILDKLSNAKKYYSFHPLFKEAFEYLNQPEFKSLAAGTYKIQGDDLYVIIADDKARDHDAKLEAHKKYIDIQVTLDGAFNIGWRALSECSSLHKEYDAENDYMLYADTYDFSMTLTPDTFAIFYPEDAHAPNAPKDFVKKAIVKVAV